MENKKIKILLVDDHEIFRSGLKFVLNQNENFEIIGEANNGKAFLSLLDTHVPDIVMLDIEMPEMNGIEASKCAIKKFPDLKIIVLSTYGEEEYYSTMILAGVQGFILKKAGINELESAILKVYKGENYFSHELLQDMVFKKANVIKRIEKLDLKITPREQEVLELISAGNSNQEIGEKLFISPLTVNNHRSSLLSKTSTKNTASLIMFAIKNKLITSE
ncbi:MAG: response regulator transcription factor [Salinivirgaceae bacterium]|nr:response regulator transcription factor [Salinivirgaceae bacterium]